MHEFVILYGYRTPTAYVHGTSPTLEEGEARLRALRDLWARPKLAHGERWTLHRTRDVVKSMKEEEVVLRDFVLTPQAPAPRPPENAPAPKRSHRKKDLNGHE